MPFEAILKEAKVVPYPASIWVICPNCKESVAEFDLDVEPKEQILYWRCPPCGKRIRFVFQIIEIKED